MKIIQFEIAQLIENKQKLEAERQLHLQKKQEMRNFFSGQLEDIAKRKTQEKEEEKQFRENYLKQMQENNMRDLAKEQNYRQVMIFQIQWSNKSWAVLSVDRGTSKTECIDA